MFFLKVKFCAAVSGLFRPAQLPFPLNNLIPLLTDLLLSLSGRGIAFEGAIHRDMGNLEVQDQNCAVAYFSGKGLIDPARVGEYWTLLFSFSQFGAAAHAYLCANTHRVGSN